MAFIIYHCSSVEAFAPLKHYCFWVPTSCAQRVLWTVMYIVCDMGNKLWCERDLIVVANFKRHLLFAISTRPRAACDNFFLWKLQVENLHILHQSNEILHIFVELFISMCTNIMCLYTIPCPHLTFFLTFTNVFSVTKPLVTSDNKSHRSIATKYVLSTYEIN